MFKISNASYKKPKHSFTSTQTHTEQTTVGKTLLDIHVTEENMLSEPPLDKIKVQSIKLDS